MNIGPNIVILFVVGISEVVAARLIWRLWRSDDLLVFKLSLSVIALVPIIGPLLAFWIGHFPDPQPDVFRDKWIYRADVFERWRRVFEERNPVKRFRRWRELMDQDDK